MSFVTMNPVNHLVSNVSDPRNVDVSVEDQFFFTMILSNLVTSVILEESCLRLRDGNDCIRLVKTL